MITPGFEGGQDAGINHFYGTLGRGPGRVRRGGSLIERVGREEVPTELIFRAIQEGDVEQIRGFMSYWLRDYHVHQGRPQSTLDLLQGVFERNMDLLHRCARGEAPGHYFYVGLDEKGTVAGTAGFVTNEHMDDKLRRVLHERETFYLPDGRQWNLLDPNAAELYFLYTDPNKKIPGVNVGRFMMDGIISEALQVSGCEWSIFSSREVWRKTGWRFHDKQPDFHLVHEDINPSEPGTRAYLVDNCYNQIYLAQA